MAIKKEETYGGAFFPTIGGLKKHPELEQLAGMTKAGSKAEATQLLTDMLALHCPTRINHYFRVKVWKDRVGLPRAAFDRLIPDFFQTVAVWNKETGEPEPMIVETHDETEWHGYHVFEEALPPALDPVRAAALDKELNAAFDNAELEREQDGETGRRLAAGRGEFVPGISDPAESKWVNDYDPREDMSDREIDIAHALNELLSGRTRELSPSEVEGDVARSGRSVSDLALLLMGDVATTEYCFFPNFADDEIHMLAASILDDWSDDTNARHRVALDAIVEYRKPAPPAKTITAPAVPDECKKEDLSPIDTVQIVESVNQGTLTYRQQLTIAALQGLCANPAYTHARIKLPLWAADMANDIIDQESISD